ncbi:hypothetical protein GCM10007301_27250 [Azorhizobium oxalatiphilum]|uniref:Beta-lactamase-related domain-containing protein n=1 Tax=Azorhizobium oxalatiphilum TaxID=980631 RepID=A0A917FCX7_9HYPH|nr:serine hydrolase domain-containing protein [Azorhizobium oxalatiphilum]GGF66130.1 hypothetical protein GCM10007301_27250 [Azorhizobium oxalatiphilum]
MSDPQWIFENQFYLDNGQWLSIRERMLQVGVPAVSVAYVGDNQTLWRAAYFLPEPGMGQAIYPDTPFQAASLSKPHAAIGVQVLFAQDGLDLSSPVIAHTSWTPPCRSCATLDWSADVTVLETLQHKGGFIGRGNTYPLDACANFTPDGGGFAGYENTPGVQLPTLAEILAGAPPANSPPIELTVPPGTFHYSGMGYVVMMRMMEDMTDTPFDDWMRENVLLPMGMSGSTYALGPPDWLPAAADGQVSLMQSIPGLRNLYPESAAAGLYTTAGDLCQTVIMLNSKGTVGGRQILSTAQATAMLEQQIGIFTAGNPDDKGYIFDHLGENYGFTAYMCGYPNQQAGWAAMVNLNNAGDFCTEVSNALIRAYSIDTTRS